LTVTDLLAFYPTFRKSYHKPHEEGAFPFFMNALKFMLSLLALENFTLTTALFPGMVTIVNFFFVGLLLWRRRVLALAAASRVGLL
jgi:hypothetical protein